MKKFSLKKGFNQISIGDSSKVKKELMDALHITSRSAWSLYLRGIYQPRYDEVQVIEQIFAQYGITNIWEEDESGCKTK